MKKYTPATNDVLCAISYGSHLYGTSTSASDFDYKAIYLPSYRDLLLGKTASVQRWRFDANGEPVGENNTMPEGGWESEHTPVQKFIQDFLTGQAYAVEFVFAVLQNAHTAHMPPRGSRGELRAMLTLELCNDLAKNFLHKNVQGMVGFAMKQTFDYVKRGERLNAAKQVLDVVDVILKCTNQEDWSTRLDTNYNASTVLDEIVTQTGLETGTSDNKNKILRTLKLNGREYLETTSLLHFRAAVEKLVNQYGDRSTKAAETDVDWKSLSHAVRVYQQVVELLDTKFITFPRPNADQLLAIKSGAVELEDVKETLKILDNTVQDKLLNTELPEVDETFRARIDEMLFNWFQSRGLYA